MRLEHRPGDDAAGSGGGDPHASSHQPSEELEGACALRLASGRCGGGVDSDVGRRLAAHLHMLSEPAFAFTREGRLVVANASATEQLAHCVDARLACDLAGFLGWSREETDGLVRAGFRGCAPTPFVLGRREQGEPAQRGQIYEVCRFPRELSGEVPLAMARLSHRNQLLERCLELNRRMQDGLERERELRRHQRALRRRQVEMTAEIERLETAATVDALSGLANRRAFDEHLGRLVLESIRNYSSLSVVLVDVDDFKGVNDNAGHATGDQLVVRLAAILGAHARRPLDLCARIGGDEFAFVFAGCGYHAAIERAAAVRDAVAAAAIPHPATNGGAVTLSLGVSSGRATDERFGEQLLRTADTALYEAKRRGKARICASRGPSAHRPEARPEAG